MGCAGSSAVVVISSQVRKFPPHVFNNIELDLNNFFPKPLENIDIDLCQEFNIGPLFNCCSEVYGIEKSRNIFYSSFKDKIKTFNKKLILITEYDKYIDTPFLEELEDFEKINKLVESNNLNKLSEISKDDYKDYLLYCNNQIFRIALYLNVMKNIKISDNFSLTHNKNEITEENINKNKHIITLDAYRTYPNLPIFLNADFSQKFHSVLLEFALRNSKMGYYQGMNFMCCYIMLLFGANQEICLYVMIKLFSMKSKLYDLCFEELFINDFALLRKYMELFHKKIDEFYPELNSHLEKIGVIDEVWIWKWFELCYLTSVQYDVVTKIFDIIMIYGIDYIVGIGLAVVELFLEDIEKSSDLILFNNVIKNGNIELNKKKKEQLYKIIIKDINTNKYNLI